MLSRKVAAYGRAGKPRNIDRSRGLDGMVGLSLNKHQQKTEETRHKLLKSAQKVFARVGFEAASIQDIAKDAGHTRGAFYAHFGCKEDLFFALLEHEAYLHSTRLQRLIEKCPDERAMLEALREYYVALTADRSWSMLMLEFKLFAVRHPKMRAKLAETHRRIRTSFRPDRIGDFWKKSEESALSTRIVLEVLLQGLILENAYDPAAFSHEEAVTVLRRVFDFLARADSGAGITGGTR